LKYIAFFKINVQLLESEHGPDRLSLGKIALSGNHRRLHPGHILRPWYTGLEVYIGDDSLPRVKRFLHSQLLRLRVFF